MIHLKYKTILLMILPLIVCACKENTPPAYDNINDIIIKGEHMTAAQYYERFCTNASPEIINHVRCTEAASQARIDALEEKIEKNLKRL